MAQTFPTINYPEYSSYGAVSDAVSVDWAGTDTVTGTINNQQQYCISTDSTTNVPEWHQFYPPAEYINKYTLNDLSKYPSTPLSTPSDFFSLKEKTYTYLDELYKIPFYPGEIEGVKSPSQPQSQPPSPAPEKPKKRTKRDRFELLDMD